MVPVRSMFLVRRRGLRLWDGDPHRTPRLGRDVLDHPDDLPRTVPVALCATRPEAEACARERERAGRRLLNPFWHYNGTAGGNSSLTEAEAEARLANLGLAPPPRANDRFQSRNWWRWYEEQAHDWPDDLFHAFWDLLDRYRLYDIVEVEMEEAPSGQPDE